MNLQIRFVVLLFSVIILNGSCRLLSQKQEDRLAVLPWDVGGRENLKVVVDLKRSGGSAPSRILRVLNDEQEVFVYETADAFLGAIPLADEKGDLLTIWSGGSSYHFLVVGFHDKKLLKLLEAGSKLPPELIFSASSLENRPYILATDGLMNEATENWSTRIFFWDGKLYQSKPPVPYPQRLSQLP